MVRRFNPFPAPISNPVEFPFRTRMWAELLERRETPSAGSEDVYSLPHLPGMSAVYPSAVQPPSQLPLLQQARPRYAVGTSGGGMAQVNVYDAPTGSLLGIINPFERTFTGGVSVATGDVTGDGIEDVVIAAGRGRAPDVKVYDGRTLKEIGSFRPYSNTFYGGVTVAVGDVTGDGRADIVTGAGIGSAPHVKMFSGAELFSTASKQLTTTPAARMNFFAWQSTHRGGVTVAVGDVNADGRGDIVVGQGPGAGGVRAFSGVNGSTLLDLKPFGTTFDGGVSVAVGDVTGDGKADVIAGAMRGDATVKVFSAGTEVAAYSAFSGKVGTRVAVQDINGDGIGEVLVSASGGTPSVKIVAGLKGTVKRAFPAMTPRYTSGLSVG
jgi:hypothetical protein